MNARSLAASSTQMGRMAYGTPSAVSAAEVSLAIVNVVDIGWHLTCARQGGLCVLEQCARVGIGDQCRRRDGEHLHRAVPEGRMYSRAGTRTGSVIRRGSFLHLKPRRCRMLPE